MSSSPSAAHISFFHWRSFRLPAARRRFLSLDRCLNTMRHLEARQIFLVSSSEELLLLRFRRSRVSVLRRATCFLEGLCVRGRELLLLSCTTAPPPQVMQLFLEAEARAELIFIFAADAFDVAEFFFDLVVSAGCKGARPPAAQPITRARAALTRACARCLVARSEWQV